MEGFDSRRLSLPRVRGRGNVQDFARGSYKPVNSFANLDMANSLDNIRTLCLRCHKLNHGRVQ